MRDGLCFSHHPSNRVVSAGRVERKAENLARSLAATRAEYAKSAQAEADRANAEAREWAAKKMPPEPGALRFLEELTGSRLQ
jgi:outer membrane murein-binding lipoprotein Lpp